MVDISFIKQQHTTTILSTNAMSVESEHICFIFIGNRKFFSEIADYTLNINTLISNYSIYFCLMSL
jgi:hypothetical protein